MSLRRLAFALALAAAIGSAGCEGSAPDPLPNVRLGMSPRDVRERFVPGGEGAWQSTVGTGDDTVLEWNAKPDAPNAPNAKVEHARFEFHLGMLVAMRASLHEPNAAERVDATPKTVSVRKPGARAGETEVTVLSRDCPTHHEEAESLARLAH